MRIANNPIDKILDVFEKNYEETARRIAKIQFVYKIGHHIYGECVFNDDGTIQINIAIIGKRNRPIGVEDITELLAHELAHAICGIEAEHGQVWEDTFERLRQLYIEEAQKEGQ